MASPSAPRAPDRSEPGAAIGLDIEDRPAEVEVADERARDEQVACFMQIGQAGHVCVLEARGGTLVEFRTRRFRIRSVIV